jgi:transcriptional regulator with XRE-family HTH domain
MGRKKAEYDPEVLNRVRLAWHAHKDKTGMSQSSAAEMLNMNQSAFSQYLRGTVSLNDVFLSKFSMLIGKDPSYFDDRLSKFAYRKESIKETGIVHIEYALSGVRYNPPKTLVVASPYVPTDRVPILVDTANFKYKEGMLMVCSTNTQSLKETQEVALFDTDKNIKAMGELYFNDSSWSVLTVVRGSIVHVKYEPTDIVLRVVGGFYPEPVYKRLFHHDNNW